jgi:hypothetical protein
MGEIRAVQLIWNAGPPGRQNPKTQEIAGKCGAIPGANTLERAGETPENPGNARGRPLEKLR